MYIEQTPRQLKRAYIQMFLGTVSLVEFLFHKECCLPFSVVLVLHYIHLFFLRCFENNYFKTFEISRRMNFQSLFRVFKIYLYRDDFIIKIPGILFVGSYCSTLQNLIKLSVAEFQFCKVICVLSVACNSSKH